MRKLTVAAAITLALSTPGLSQSDQVGAFAGMYMAEHRCGLTVPQEAKMFVLRRALATMTAERFADEVKAMVRMMEIEFTEIEGVALTFCVDMGEMFE